MANQVPRKVRITIRLDEEVVEHFKFVAMDADVPYQWLINRVLREHIASKEKLVTKFN